MQGVAHLAHGLAHRHYVPEAIGQAGSTGIAGPSVWLHAALLGMCIVVVGTHEETYLALYAAGVFVLLSMTGWAAVARLVSIRRHRKRTDSSLALFAVGIAAVMTSFAAALIFWERFDEGAWLYAVLVPILYAAMAWVRRLRGDPSAEEDELGRRLACSCFGRGGVACACDCCESMR